MSGLRSRVMFGKERTPGELGRVLSLLRAARAEFGRLSKAERAVVVAASLGEVADFSDQSPGYIEQLDRAIAAERAAAEANDTRDRTDFPERVCSAAWRRPEPQVSVRSSLVRWLLVCPAAVVHVHAEGVWVSSCRVDDAIDCSGCDVERPLALVACVLHGVLLLDARTRRLVLNGTMLRAAVGSGDAFKADGAEIGGDVFFGDGFRAEGTVRLVGVKITGDLACSGGSFITPGGNALSADRVEIGGGVFFSDRFRAEGEVRLLAAKIVGSLACPGGSFITSGGDALSADRVEIGGNVFFNKKFRAEGEVRLPGAKITGGLACSGGSFINPGKKALNADGARIDGTLFIRELTDVQGRIDLTRATVRYMSDGDDGTLSWPSEIILTAFSYEGIHPLSPLDARTRLQWLKAHDTTFVGIYENNAPDPQPYRQLAEVLKKQGHERDAAEVMRGYWVGRTRWEIDRHRRRLANSKVAARWPWVCAAVVWADRSVWLVWGRAGALGRRSCRWWRCIDPWWVVFWRRLANAVVGHGYDRWRALWWLAGLVLIGAVVFSFQGGRRMQPVQMLALREFGSAWDQPRMAAEGNELARRYPKFHPVLYSMDALIPLVSFHQEEYWTPRVDPRAKGWDKFASTSWWIKIYHTVHISLGWIIATLFAASFTKLMRSD